MLAHSNHNVSLWWWWWCVCSCSCSSHSNWIDDEQLNIIWIWNRVNVRFFRFFPLVFGTKCKTVILPHIFWWVRKCSECFEFYVSFEVRNWELNVFKYDMETADWTLLSEANKPMAKLLWRRRLANRYYLVVFLLHSMSVRVTYVKTKMFLRQRTLNNRVSTSNANIWASKWCSAYWDSWYQHIRNRI